MRTHLFVSAAVLFALSAIPASAQLWSAAGSTGIIDEAALNLFGFSGPSLQFRPGAVGTIVARYRVYADVSNLYMTRATTATNPRFNRVAIP